MRTIRCWFRTSSGGHVGNNCRILGWTSTPVTVWSSGQASILARRPATFRFPGNAPGTTFFLSPYRSSHSQKRPSRTGGFRLYPIRTYVDHPRENPECWIQRGGKIPRSTARHIANANPEFLQGVPVGFLKQPTPIGAFVSWSRGTDLSVLVCRGK